MARQFHTLDVFTNEPLGGNPLAVVTDCQGLDDKRMQAIAAEFNLSETVFVGPPTDSANRANIRIFTPKNELPFAGHPTVGTAILLATLGDNVSGASTNLVLEEKVGLVSCEVSFDGGLANARFALPKIPTHDIVKFDENKLARALGLDVSQLGIPGHTNAVFNAGVPFPVVPLADLEAMASIRLDEAALDDCFKELGFALELYVYTKQCVNEDSDYHVRLFAPAMGIAEDPATGSAAAAFSAQIMAFDDVEDGEHVFVIEQGIEMGRPSRIELTVEVSAGDLVDAHIGGNAVIVSEGKLHL